MIKIIYMRNSPISPIEGVLHTLRAVFFFGAITFYILFFVKKDIVENAKDYSLIASFMTLVYVILTFAASTKKTRSDGFFFPLFIASIFAIFTIFSYFNML